MTPLRRVLFAVFIGSGASTAACAQDVDEWTTRLAALRTHNEAAFQVGPRIVDAPRDVAMTAVRDAWPSIDIDGVKTGLLKAFHFGQHPDVLEVLHLGATDSSDDVRQYAFGYLRTFAWRDFVANPDDYAAWRETYAGMDVEDVLHANVVAWVKRYEKSTSDEQEQLQAEMDRLGLLGTPNTKTYRPSVLRYARQAGMPDALLNADASAQRAAQREMAATEPAVLDLFAGGDTNKRYFLIDRGEDAPPDGYKLLVVIPGGTGGEDFQPFVKRMTKEWLPQGYIVAQLVAKEWTPGQFVRVVWPTAKLPIKEAEFTTDAFVEAVVTDVGARKRIISDHVYVMGWSSGGPPAYAATLAEDSSIRGAFILASVFRPFFLPDLSGAEGKSFFILHSPEDFIPIRMAEQARDALQDHGARTLLETYADGHGWPRQIDVVARGMAFLERD